MTDRKLIEEIRRSLYPAYEEILDADGLAKLLKLSKSYVYKHQNDFPHVWIGGSVRFPRTKVLEAIILER